MFTLQIALEKINSGSIQIDFERRLYCDYWTRSNQQNNLNPQS